ncbi:hypothetical protein CHUAL_000769 [Chamberlinius hualienensis]
MMNLNSNRKFIALIVTFLIETVIALENEEAYYGIHYLSNPKEEVMVQTKDPDDNLFIFCYKGESRNWLNVWKTVGVQLSIKNENFEVFQGENETEVEYSYRQSSSVFHFMPWRTKFIDFDLYKKSCIGVYSQLPFSATLEVNYINFWKVSRLSIGLVMYILAPPLSRNVIFYYSTGVVLGISASLLIVVYFISRAIPKKFGAVSVLVGGWAVVLYVLQILLSNLQVIAIQYQSYVVTYLVVVGFLSFALCYKYGTVDARTQNLIKWLLQAIGLLFIFLSTDWREVSTSIILVIVSVDKFPAKWKAKIRTYVRRRFPTKIKLLTEDEYHNQGVDETKKALLELREFCNSPKCESWKIMRKLKSPMRFAGFVDGDSHLSNDEILDYELSESLVDDDVSFSDDDDGVNATLI